MGKKEDSHPEPRDLVLYKNLDAYSVGQNSPDISFYQELYKYKSVEDYLNKKNKKRKKMKRRKKMLQSIASDNNYLDFPTDSQITPIPTSPSISGANQIGGIADYVTPPPDFFGKDIGTNLNYGVAKDYPQNPKTNVNFWNKLINILLSSNTNLEDALAPKDDLTPSNESFPLTPAEPPIQGIPDGIIDKQDQDHTYTNKGYGITDSGNKIYNGAPFPVNRY